MKTFLQLREAANRTKRNPTRDFLRKYPVSDAEMAKPVKKPEKKKEEKQGEAEVAFKDPSPMMKDSIKQDKIRSLKNLIAVAKVKGIHHKVKEYESELKKLKETTEVTEAVKLNSKVKIHAPGKDYHGKVGHVGEIRKGLHDKAPKTYTVDYDYDTKTGNKKSIQLDKSRLKMHKEEAEMNEAVSVKKANYSWGKMVTVRHGSDTSYPLHPEHQAAIKKLKPGESTSFTDETNRKVTASREGDQVHLSGRGSNKRTTVAHSHFAEGNERESVFKSEIDEAGPFSYGAKPPRKGSVAYNALMKRKEQDRNRVKEIEAIGTKNHHIGVAKVTKAVAEGYTGRETKDGTWRVFKDGQAVAVAGPFNSRDEAHAWIKNHHVGVAKVTKEEIEGVTEAKDDMYKYIDQSGGHQIKGKSGTYVGYTHSATKGKGANILKHNQTKKYYAAGGSSTAFTQKTTLHDTPEDAARAYHKGNLAEASPMIKPPKNEFGKKEDAFAHAKQHGGKVMKKTFTHPTSGMQTVSYVVKKD